MADTPRPAAIATVLPVASAVTVTTPASVSEESSMNASVRLSNTFTVTAPAKATDVLELLLNDNAKAPEIAVLSVSLVARTSRPSLLTTTARRRKASAVSSMMLTETLPETAIPHLVPAGVSVAFADASALAVLVPAAASVPVPIVPVLVA